MDIHLFAALALAVLPAWSCALLLLWLLRRRRLRPQWRAQRVESGVICARSPRAKPDWICKKVIYLAAHLGSCRQVAMAFNRWHGMEVTIGKTCAWEMMRKHASEIDELRRAIRRKPPDAVAVGHTWALDLTFFVSPAGATFTVLGILDAGSRKLLCLRALPRKCAFTVLGHVLLAIAEHGLPRFIRTDNEAMFCSRLWALTLRALAITHRRGPPAQPWRNGRIERFFGTLKAALGRKWTGSAAALQQAIDGFGVFYNTARPHQALSGLTPQEAWRGMVMRDVWEVQAALRMRQ